MRFGAAFWIQRTDWPGLREACVAAERAGWDTIWLDDHLLSDEASPDDPKLEGWASLHAVASVTSRARLGLLVSSTTFRNPGVIAKLATTLDHVSGGRAVLGLGGGWFDREHEAFGIDFGSGFGERLDRLDEATMLIRRLLDGERLTHRGQFFEMKDALCEPRPVQTRLPILIGGSGKTKTLRTTARYADIWNAYGSPERFEELGDVLEERCAEVGRDPGTIERTVTTHTVLRDTSDSAMKVWQDQARVHDLEGKLGSDGSDRGLSFGGPPAAFADLARRYAAAGIDEVIVVFRTPFDTETMERIGEVRAALED
ncbi:MAG: TIGR03560 family F420-dependent LLM class oxidoreductase [Chloroflexota bacterium]